VISKTVDVTVTSVLQTPAGKMIFARYEERQHGGPDRAPRDAASGGAGGGG